ncbi:MAG: ketoacyl-ACP synthase III, partial [Phycisphaerae bacterium]|nr:ketoacyl-ACP synthase III [Phycisphaerae bacterium]
ASHAATRAMKAAGVEAKDIDLVIVGTITPEMLFPSTACFVAASLGMSSTPAFDVSAACSGFIFALETGANFVQTGRYRNVLVVGAETLSRITDYTDRSSCILFGDGAGAVVLQRSTEQGRGLIYSSLHSDGNGWEMLYCQPGSRHPIDATMVAGRQQFMKIKGREVYKFAVQRFCELLEDALRKCELTRDNIKLVVPHQVNQRIIDSAIEKLNLPPEKAFVNIDRYGNTSAASIPLALDEAVRAGRLVKGDIAVFVAFGAGLTWANAVVKM